MASLCKHMGDILLGVSKGVNKKSGFVIFLGLSLALHAHIIISYNIIFKCYPSSNNYIV